MTVNEVLRALAGTFTLVSLALGWWLHPAYLLFAVFVGLNLLQSAFTGWCPVMPVLRKIGLKEC